MFIICIKKGSNKIYCSLNNKIVNYHLDPLLATRFEDDFDLSDVSINDDYEKIHDFSDHVFDYLMENDSRFSNIRFSKSKHSILFDIKFDNTLENGVKRYSSILKKCEKISQFINTTSPAIINVNYGNLEVEADRILITSGIVNPEKDWELLYSCPKNGLAVLNTGFFSVIEQVLEDFHYR